MNYVPFMVSAKPGRVLFPTPAHPICSNSQYLPPRPGGVAGGIHSRRTDTDALLKDGTDGVAFLNRPSFFGRAIIIESVGIRTINPRT